MTVQLVAHPLYEDHDPVEQYPVDAMPRPTEEASIVEAIEGNLAAFLLYSGRVPRTKVRIAAEYLSIQTGLADPSMNAVIRASFTSSDLDAQLASVLAPFKASQTPLVWWIFPTTHPDDLGTYLTAQGLTYRGEGPGMAADLLALPSHAPAPVALTIEEVNSEAALRDWIMTADAACGSASAPAVTDPQYLAFELQRGWGAHLPYRRYLARLSGKPVATSALFLGAGVAGIYNVATIPEARSRGIGAAITLAPLHAARAQGYRVGVLESSPLGRHIYSRLGFREHCRIHSYVWLPDKWN